MIGDFDMIAEKYLKQEIEFITKMIAFFDTHDDFGGYVFDPWSLYGRMRSTIYYWCLHNKPSFFEDFCKAKNSLCMCLYELGYTAQEYGDDIGQVIFNPRGKTTFTKEQIFKLKKCLNDILDIFQK